MTDIRDLRRGLLVTCDTKVLGTAEIHGADSIVEHVIGDAQVWLPGVKHDKVDREE